MKKMLSSLSKGEYVLILETEKDRMDELDEDDLIALHTGVRRARIKYTKNYRRPGSAKVSEKKSCGSGKGCQ